MKRTFQPKKNHKNKVHGFRAKFKDSNEKKSNKFWNVYNKLKYFLH